MAISHIHTERRSTPDGEYIGDYKLLGRVGSGGMATVFKVKDPAGKTWALKEMRPQAEAHKEMTRRFRQEFEVTSRLDHRNIVGVHDFFAAKETLHIVMEYVNGVDLRTVLSFGGTLDDGRLARLGVDIAAGMAHAHVQGILHRDLKPENILLSKRGQVKVVDFGVARVQGTRLTATGIIVGSPAYMSPEQLAGVGGQDLTEAADVYSFGVVLYELAEGRDPLGLRKHEDLLTVLRVKREGTPRPFRRVKNPELAALIQGCLESNPDDRPSSMEEIRKRLLRIVRSCSTRREDVKALATVAMANYEAGRKAKGKAAPLPAAPPAPAPAPSRRPPRVPRTPPRAVAAAATRPAPSGDWSAPAMPAAMSGHQHAPEPAPIVAPRTARRPRPATGPVEKRGVARWFEPDARATEGLGAVAAGEPRIARDEDSPPRSVTSGRVASKVVELSFKTRKPNDAAGFLTWMALVLFAVAVLFFGASASLTGSPLGLLERLIPMP
ncbi:MAG: serine/threonine protein kinase [Deltaproteobacteria bacterium]|nr:serine/threonine protein kinase [Deltaproteobacteria bacterium]